MPLGDKLFSLVDQTFDLFVKQNRTNKNLNIVRLWKKSKEKLIHLSDLF